MKTIVTISELKQAVAGARAEGKTVGLVPTMGALHVGHLSLIKRACDECDFVVISVFVNPTQFNNPEDLRTYPRTLEADKKLIEDNTSAQVVFAPSVEEVYPEPDTRQFSFGPIAEVMEGEHRPGHFNGVAQIVSKLFMFVEPDKAYFGEKDFQQLAIIRKMVKDYKFNIQIVGCPIVRYMDGLAVSSRNALLQEDERAIAPIIQATLRRSVEEMQYKMTPAEVIAWVTKTLNNIEHLEVEYYSIVDGLTLQPINEWNETNYVVGCITCYCGKVRLIDNITYKVSE
ncbi:MAG: pantoate--beta-alanine ligase [Bacteroidales bacterium]|nr:pantoate--beta-alanine ligase [Bacteroidales bacterium]